MVYSLEVKIYYKCLLYLAYYSLPSNLDMMGYWGKSNSRLYDSLSWRIELQGFHYLQIRCVSQKYDRAATFLIFHETKDATFLFFIKFVQFAFQHYSIVLRYICSNQHVSCFVSMINVYILFSSNLDEFIYFVEEKTFVDVILKYGAGFKILLKISSRISYYCEPKITVSCQMDINLSHI